MYIIIMIVIIVVVVVVETFPMLRWSDYNYNNDPYLVLSRLIMSTAVVFACKDLF